MSDTPQDPRIAVLVGLGGMVDASAILAALDAVDPARVWRPIAEAPRDGTWVLVPCEWDDCPAVEPVRIRGRHWTGLDGAPYWPTHFLPLPEPPEAP
jgi:hypothetical protein